MKKLCYEIETKKLDNTPIYYYAGGNRSGEAILFIHSAFADHTSFDNQVEYFSRNYLVITMDIIGHGRSNQTKKGDSIVKTSDYIYQIMLAEHLEKLHLVGVSIGAVLIQDFANKYPNSVASLSCIGGYDINNFDTSMQKENSGEQIKMMLKAIFSIKWFAKSNKLISAITPEAQEAFYKMNIKFKKSSFRYLVALSQLVNKYKTKKRTYPLLIGCGDKDIPMEIKAAKMWHESEPKSELIVFENAGHLVNMDVPNEFNHILEKLLLSRL